MTITGRKFLYNRPQNDRPAQTKALAAGAALDTITGEPVQADHPMLQAEPAVEAKILYSCHIGGITGSSFRRGYEMIWSDFAKAAAGEKPDHVVNPW